MPFVHVRMIEGRTKEQKDRLVKAITRDVAEICETKPEGVWVVIEDVPKINWGVAGTLLADRK